VASPTYYRLRRAAASLSSFLRRKAPTSPTDDDSGNGKPRRRAIVGVVKPRWPNAHPFFSPGDLPGVSVKAATLPKGEVGVTGLDARSGRIYQEYSARLQNLRNRMAAYEEMRRSDSAVAVLENIITLPVRQAQWFVKPGDDEQLSDAIAENIFHGLSHPFEETIRQACLAVLYGFTIHEKVYETKPDGFLGWRKFAERARTTVAGWEFDSTGGLKAVKQSGRKPDTGSPVSITIPIERLLVWTWRGEAGDPEGIGVLRQAYKHWYYKQVLEEFAAIRIERQACGLPMAYGPEIGFTEEEASQVLASIEAIRAAEAAGMVVPAGWHIEWADLGRADVPFESHIERQHSSILQTALGHFVGLGQGGDRGSLALSRDATTFFFLACEAIADWICSTFNLYAMRQLCYFNNNNPGALPQLAHGKLGVRDPDRFTRAVARLFDPDLVIPPEVEDYVRDELGMPPRPENTG